MKWRKPSPELIETFESVSPGPPAVIRKMFGFPAGFINGHMFMGLHQENMIVRLPEQLRTELLQIKGARIFEPMPGRPMREYVVLPTVMLSDPRKLSFWIAKALEYGSSLKPKTGKSPTKKKNRSKRDNA